MRNQKVATRTEKYLKRTAHAASSLSYIFSLFCDN